MKEWILILTIVGNYSGYSSGSGATIQQVEPFKTQQACLDAGSFWLKKNYQYIIKIEKDYNGQKYLDRYGDYSTICVTNQ